MKRCIAVLLMAALLPSPSYASFSETSRRYVSPRDIFNLLHQKFPVVGDTAKIRKLKATCWAIGGFNMNLIGAVNPAVGAPAAEQPVTGFVRWLGTCGRELIQLQITQLKEKPDDVKLWSLYFPEGFVKKYQAEIETKPWSSVPAEERRQVVKWQIENLIGPEAVIKDLGFAESASALADLVEKAVANEGSIEAAAKTSLLALLLREEFISY